MERAVLISRSPLCCGTVILPGFLGVDELFVGTFCVFVDPAIGQQKLFDLPHSHGKHLSCLYYTHYAHDLQEEIGRSGINEVK